MIGDGLFFVTKKSEGNGSGPFDRAAPKAACADVHPLGDTVHDYVNFLDVGALAVQTAA
jgi:hypothetical protein